MKRRAINGFASLTKCLASLLILSFLVCSADAADRPNIVFMMSDDQAWNGLSVPMSPALDWSKSSIVETPNLEKLATQGMRFSAAYAPASVCAPTRISLQTGKSPAAVHWTKASGSVTAADGYKMIGPRNVRQIDRHEITIGELLRDAGYRAAHFGKWHINGGGGRGRRGGLSGGKGSVWEGGIRSPFIIRGPGIPENSWCHERIVGYDLFPTYCEWAGIASSNLPSDIEGGSIVNLLDDGKGIVRRPREEMVFHFPHYQSGDGPHSALFLENYKLMKFYETDRLALFDIATDVSEQNDLSQQMPQKVRELDKLLVKYLNDVAAQMARPNPQYDPDNRPKRESRKGGKSQRRKQQRKRPSRDKA